MALRNLLGNDAKAIVHDPGPKGESGEGDAALVMIFLNIAATIAILVYEKFFKKKEEDSKASDPNDYHDDKTGVVTYAMEAVESGTVDPAKMSDKTELTPEEKADLEAQARWLQPSQEKIWMKVVLLFVVFYCLWVFLLTLGIMGTGFSILGGKDSAGMFDVVDNPISGVMIGILATVLVQSSSTTTSIIIALVGANELSVRNAVFMVMGANIGTSVTNTIVAMGHFANQDDLRRGFAAATVHDIFNMLTVAIFLPLNWIYPFFEKMTYEMVKDVEACDKTEVDCVSQDFLKPYIEPYSKGIAGYDKKVAEYITQGYCAGQCPGYANGKKDAAGKALYSSYNKEAMQAVQDLLCLNNGTDCSKIHKDYDTSWMSNGVLSSKRAPGFFTVDENGVAGKFSFTQPTMPAGQEKAVNFFNGTKVVSTTLKKNTVYKVCDKVSLGLCDKRLLKGGLVAERWDMTDEGAGTFLTILSLVSLCSCLFLTVYFLQIIVKGPAARVLRQVVGFNGYLNIAIGLVVTIIVQSSSITTSTLTPLAAVGLITLEDMLPLTLGANIGTTLTGIMAATVATSNAVGGWQVALCHLFFNIFGILIWYPVPRARQIPLAGARWLGKMTAHPKIGKFFPLIYTFTVFLIIPGICYGIAVAATQ